MEAEMLPDGLAAPHGDVGVRLADLPTGLLSPLPVQPDGPQQQGIGGNAAGSGGSGTFQGTIVQQAQLDFSPYNEASGGSYGTSIAQQMNWMKADQASLQVAGLGG